MRAPWFDRVAGIAVFVLEATTMVLLVALVLLAIAALLVQLAATVAPPFLTAERVTAVLDEVLAVFVLIELLATALAYLRGTDVLRRIFEAVFVAIARKLITLDFHEAPLAKAGAIAALLVATGITWRLVERPRVEDS